MSAKHTRGPWKAHHIETKAGLPYTPVSANTLLAKVYSEAFGNHAESEANARRIVACVNACEGFSIEELEDANLFQDSIESANLIDDLLAALEELSDYADRFSVSGVYLNEEIEGKRLLKNAAAAIAKATAQK